MLQPSVLEYNNYMLVPGADAGTGLQSSHVTSLKLSKRLWNTYKKKKLGTTRCYIKIVFLSAIWRVFLLKNWNGIKVKK